MRKKHQSIKTDHASRMGMREKAKSACNPQIQAKRGKLNARLPRHVHFKVGIALHLRFGRLLNTN